MGAVLLRRSSGLRRDVEGCQGGRTGIKYDEGEDTGSRSDEVGDRATAKVILWRSPARKMPHIPVDKDAYRRVVIIEFGTLLIFVIKWLGIGTSNKVKKI